MKISELEPKEVWSIFSEICKIPRKSKHEERIIEWLLNFAKKEGIDAERDKIGNIRISKPASPGKENSPGVVLQGHVDMVCQKNEETKHDFSKDPIKVKIEGDCVCAEGTTLVADNGLGIAMALAIATSKKIKHAPLEVILTVDEETGLSGATHLKPGFIKGKKLINLDSEEFGVITIGCAGSGNSMVRMPLEWNVTPKGMLAFSARLGGLRGGHSGTEIHLRPNAVKLLSGFLWDVVHEIPELQFAEVRGGTEHNAIPREAVAKLVVFPESEKKLREIASRNLNEWKESWGKQEKNMVFKIEREANTSKVISRDTTIRISNLLFSLPNGALEWSKEVPDLVETSTNLAIVKTGEDGLEILQSTRSSISSALERTRKWVEAVAEANKASTSHGESYSGWKPNPDSPLLRLSKEIYRKLFGEEPAVGAIHAGLETGVIGSKYPGMDMISIGPTIENAHSPGEKVDIESAKKFWKYLVALVEAI